MFNLLSILITSTAPASPECKQLPAITGRPRLSISRLSACICITILKQACGYLQFTGMRSDYILRITVSNEIPACRKCGNEILDSSPVSHVYERISIGQTSFDVEFIGPRHMGPFGLYSKITIHVGIVLYQKGPTSTQEVVQKPLLLHDFLKIVHHQMRNETLGKVTGLGDLKLNIE